MNPGNEAAGPGAEPAYGAKWSANGESPTRQRIKRAVYGDAYPVEADPRGYVTLTELRAVARDLRVGPEQTFVDLGCGPGGPGLWVARATGAALVGLEVSSAGVAQASERAGALGVTDRARFQAADLSSTGLPDASFDAAMSIDVLWAVPDKLGALREIARILKPSARLAFTNWDRDLSPPGYLPPLGDHRPLLRQAGFEIETYQLQPGAEDLRRAVYEAFVAAEHDFIREMGEEGARKVMFEAKGTLGLVDGTDYLAHSRRIYVVARNASPSAARK